MRSSTALAKKELSEIYTSDEINFIIYLIVSKLKSLTRTQYLLSKDDILSNEEHEIIASYIQRLKNNEPIQYVLGETEFYESRFITVPEVLIPRPETEELVQMIINENKIKSPKILDIGTGSGCIAISLKKHIPESEVFAVDISDICIETATKNAELNSSKVNFIKYDILSETINFPTTGFDLIVSNPPYVRESEKKLMGKNVLDYEPALALFVNDNDPLLYYRQIAIFARKHLNSGAKLYFEINEAFGEECAGLLDINGFSDIKIREDLFQKPRFVSSVYNY